MDNEQNTIKGRLASVDALRGFSMFWIVGGAEIIRNLNKAWDNPTTRFLNEQMHHPKWLGLHFLDLIFPLFLFVVGLVLPFSISKRIRQALVSKPLQHWFWRIGKVTEAPEFSIECPRWLVTPASAVTGNLTVSAGREKVMIRTKTNKMRISI